MSEYQREYICRNCYLIYEGKCPWDAKAEICRRPCPECGEISPVATDTFGCFYWEQGLVDQHGPDFFVRHYWWKPEHVTEETAKRLEGRPWSKGKPPEWTEPMATYVI